MAHESEPAFRDPNGVAHDGKVVRYSGYVQRGVLLGASAASHLVAIVASIVALIIVQISGYAFLVLLGLILDGDPGGWLNFILVPIASVAFAIVVTLVVFVPFGLLFTMLRNRNMIPWWSPPALFFLFWMVIPVGLAFALSTERAGANMLNAAAWMAAVTMLFLYYWVILRAGLGGSRLVSAAAGFLVSWVGGSKVDKVHRGRAG